MNGLILLVEDNEQILYGNERMLKRRGYDVMTALTLREARERMLSSKPDALVLDIMLPDGSGLDFLHELRRDSNIPVLLLTGLKTQGDIVHGLTEGGDDYITKPYHFGELLARLEALLRRAGRLPDILRKGSLTLDVIAGHASVDGQTMQLTQKEFALLLTFVQNEGTTMSAELLYEKIWKVPLSNDKRSLQKHISTLRTKLDDSRCGYTISAAYGEGYRFEAGTSY